MADLAAVTQCKIPSVSNIVKGEEDGEIEFTYTPIAGAESIVVTIISGGKSTSAALISCSLLVLLSLQ